MSAGEMQARPLRAHRARRALVLATAAVANFSVVGLAPGVSITWANTGTTFSAGSNWIGGTAPANSTTADVGIFQGTPVAQPFLSATRSIGGLDIQSSGWVFSGARLTLGSGIAGVPHVATTGNPTGNLTFNNGLAFSDSPITFNSTLDIAFNGLVEGIGTGASRTLNFDGPSNAVFTGGLNIHAVATATVRTFTIAGTGNGNVTINTPITVLAGNTASFRNNKDNGTVFLTQANSYNNGTELSGGVLNINQDAALGVSPAGPVANNIRVTGISTLQLANGLGAIALDPNRGVFIGGSASAGRTFTFDTGDNTVTFAHPLTEQNTGTILVVGNFTKHGSGTMILQSVNSLSGSLSFAGGTLVIDNPASLGNGALRWGGGTLMASAPLNVTIPSMLTNASSIAGSQTITFSGPLQYNGSTDRSERFDQDPGIVTQVNGGLVISSATGPRQVSISGAGEVAINSVISETTGNAGTLRIINDGTVTLAMANTYTGGTIFDDVDADVNIGDDASLGTGPITWNAGSLRSTGGARTISNPVALSFGDTKLVADGNGDFTFTGPVTVQGGGQRVFSVGTFGTATFSNVVSESDGTGFAKAGAGTLVLDAANTYAGGTGVRNGWLVISNDNNLGNASTAVDFDGGTLLTSASVTSGRLLSVALNGGTFDTGAFNSTFTNDATGTGSFTKRGSGNLTVRSVRPASLTVADGTLTIAANGSATGASNVGVLSVPASLDLNDNDMLVTATPTATVVGMVVSARNGGAWDGQGITSSAARTQPNQATTLGVLSGADYTAVNPNAPDFNGFTVVGSDTLVKYTWYGDADFNGEVNFDDYILTDNGFNGGLGGWVNGDFDFSGAVDFDDYIFIDLGFNSQNGTLRRAQAFLDGSDRSRDDMSSDPALRMVTEHFDQFGVSYARNFLSAVPEPGVIGVLGLAGLVLARRRRR